jgi:hypothetical protein
MSDRALPEELQKALERIPVGAVEQDRAVIDALAAHLHWPYPDDPFTMALRLCDEDGIVRKGAMHHDTDYPCTGHAHFSGEHVICATPIHWREVSHAR